MFSVTFLSAVHHNTQMPVLKYSFAHNTVQGIWYHDISKGLK